MSFNGGIFQGNIKLVTLLALLVGAALTVGALTITSGHLIYNGHISQLQNNSGTLCLSNQTISCGTGSGGGAAPKISINGNNRSSFTNVLANVTTIGKIQGENMTSRGYAILKGNVNSSAIQFKTITCGNFMSCSQNNTNVRINSTGITITSQKILYNSTDKTYSSSSYLDTNLNATMPTRTNGVAYINFKFTVTMSASAPNMFMRVVENNQTKDTILISNGGVNGQASINIPYVTTLSGQNIKIQAKISSGNFKIFESNSDGNASIYTLELSTP